MACGRSVLRCLRLFTAGDALHNASYPTSRYISAFCTDPFDPSESRFNKILVANRGEIACRVIKTAREMGIKTVAVYSMADARARHVRLADEAVCIGPAPAKDSYLNMDCILEAVKSTHSEAVHPGYGFLSENATFVERLEEENTTFIGPSIQAINGMGDKLESKRLAAAAGVNTIPGFDGIIKNADHCIQIAKDIGYPVMIKASAGGGGKGMRIAKNDNDASMFLDEWTRAAMGQQAVSLCKQLGYYSAGTVEFLVDSQQNFYFLEMNTRLQVEHPVTECITGVDLVHQMIRIAKGHPLKLKQQDIPKRGWAIECRVYSEDPYKNFGLPSIGRLYKYIEPLHIPNVRCDSGIEEGSEISIYYDPMICKLVSYGETRKEAIATSIKALDAYVIRGVTHNIPLLRDILTEKHFFKGDITTHYLPEVYPEGFKGRNLSTGDRQHIMAVAASLYCKLNLRACLFLNQRPSTAKSTEPSKWNLVMSVLEDELSCMVERVKDKFLVHIGSDTFVIMDNFNPASPLIQTNINEKEVVMQLISKSASGDFCISYQGTAFTVSVLSEEANRLLKMMPKKAQNDASKKRISSPMPGVVKSVSCEVGEEISDGQEVCVIEAMKMQNSLVAATTGIVRAVYVKPGHTVGEDDVLVEFE